MTDPTTGEVTGEMIQVLARIDAAECFRSLGTERRRGIDDATARLCGDTSKAVAADALRSCIDRGLAVRPAAGQIALTSAGRAELARHKEVDRG